MRKMLPVFLDLENRPVLLVGAGSVAVEKLQKLKEACANITIVSPKINPQIEGLSANSNQITLIKRPFEATDIRPGMFVFIAVNDSNVRRFISKTAKEAGAVVNSADDPATCDFLMTGSLHFGPLEIAISSRGQNPGLVREFRMFLQSLFPENHGQELVRFSQIRRQVRQVTFGEKRLSTLRRLNHLLARFYLKPVLSEEEPYVS